MSVQLLGTGAWLTVWGMGLVFLLLALLWGLVALLLRFDRPVRQDAAAGRGASAPPAGGLPPELLAAVMVAVRMHVHALRKEAAPEARRHRPGSLPSRWVSAGRTRQNRSWSSGGRYT